MSFDSHGLLGHLQSLVGETPVARWIVAFSGGIDSTVLLHALASSGTESPILAVHVDHGLHSDSPNWVSHCREIARNLEVEFLALRVTVSAHDKAGPEAAARVARYDAFRDIVAEHDCLLSAHHQGDQSETVVLNLMRGSGVDGLAAINACRTFGQGMLLRPMLNVTAADVSAYAEERGLKWMDDPSNVDTEYDRNFLRHKVMPVLAERWPAVSRRVAHSAGLLREASILLAQLADIDLEQSGPPNRLKLSVLSELPQARQRNLLRRAVRLCGLPAPPATRLQQIIDELIPARADARPLVAWAGAEARRYRDEVFLLEPIPGVPDNSGISLSSNGDPESLAPLEGTLKLVRTKQEGISPAAAQNGLEVRFRTGGEVIQRAGQDTPQKLKKLFQEDAVLPWRRSRIPLLFAGETLVAVGDLWIDQRYVDSPGFKVHWDNRPLLR